MAPFVTGQGKQVIVVGQALHGYDDGHTLLSSSEPLPHSSEAIMFVLSDLSGSTLVAGFEEYLTGYPLPDIHSFAFAKTWYADEMDRPGCVWTHTLLIRNADLARVSQLFRLVDLFRRPSVRERPWRGYERQVQIEMEGSGFDTNTTSKDSASVQLSKVVLDSLYGLGNAPVTIAASNAKSLEGLLLAIWSQQWPRLRRNFLFCSGALEPRVYNGKPFDLQVMPRSSVLRLARETPDVIVVDPDRAVSPNLPDDALSLIQADFFQANPGFRDFTRSYGADITPDRPSFRKLAESFVEIDLARRGAVTCFDLLSKVFHLFPLGEEAAKLKGAVLGIPDHGISQLALPFSSRDCLVAVGKVDSEMFSERTAIDLPVWVATLLRNSSKETLEAVYELAGLSGLSRLGEQLINEIAKQISMDQLLDFRATPALMLALSGRNIELAMSPATWRVVAHRSHELIDLLVSHNIDSEGWKRATIAAIESGVPDLAHALTKIAGVPVILEALGALQGTSPGFPLSNDWYAETANHIDYLLDWLPSQAKISVILLDRLAQRLDPFDWRIAALDSQIWLPLLGVATLEIRASVFLFTIGCQGRSPATSRLVSSEFPILHRAAEMDSLGPASWQLLREILPDFGMFRNWDVCERLRQLLVEKFVKFDWPMDEFLSALRDPVVLTETLAILVSKKEFRGYARRLAERVSEGDAAATREQQEILAKFDKKLRR